MTRTEDDLHRLYRDDPDAATVERRLQAWIASGVPEPKPVRWVAPVSAAAAVVAVAATVAVVPHLNGSPYPAGSAGSPARTSMTSPSASTTSASAGVTSTAARSVGGVMVTPQVLARTLLDLLPGHGSVSQLQGRTFQVGQLEPGGPRYHELDAFFQWKDGRGTSSVSVEVLVPYAGDHRKAQSLCARVEGKAGSRCTVLPDGSQLRTHERASIASNPLLLMNQVELQRPDGFEVLISATNTGSVKGKVSRKQPAFTGAQLDVVARSPRWQPEVSRAEVKRDAHLFKPRHH